MISGRTNFGVGPNANGQCFVNIYPYGLAGTNFVVIYADSTFNPTTGAQTPAGTVLNGPQYPNAATIRTMKLNKFSIKILPTQSVLQSQGLVTSTVWF